MAAEAHPRARFEAFWRGRSRRERALLVAAAIVVGLGLLYGAVYEPLDRARSRLAQRLPTLRAEHRLMTVQVAEIERLGRQGKAETPGGEALLHRIEASARAAGLGERVASLAPAGGETVQVLTGAGPAAAWAKWLMDLDAQGIRVRACRIVATGQPGQASLEATLAGSGGR